MKKNLLFVCMLFTAVALKAQYYYPSGDTTAPSWAYYNVVTNYGDYSNPSTGKSGDAIEDAYLYFPGITVGDAWDGAFEFFINVQDSVYTDAGADSVGGVDTTGTTFSLLEQLINGLYVSKKYYFSPAEPVVRVTYKLRNPSATAISVKAVAHTNLGSDGQTIMDSSSSGIDSLVNTDRWMITSDGTGYPNGDAVNTWVRFGPGTIACTPVFGDRPESGTGSYSDTIAVTVPANSYVLFMQLNRLDSSVSAATAHVATFNTVAGIHDAGYLTGMTDEELLSVVNWDFSSLICSVDTSVTQNDIELTANAAGLSYQWLDCNNSYAAIPGATSQTYTATANGNFAVAITASGACTDTSSCHSVLTFGLNENNAEVSLSVYPNPSNGIVTILTGSIADEIRILDVVGNVIMTLKPANNYLSVDLSNQAEGFYMIEMTTNHQKKFARLAITR